MQNIKFENDIFLRVANGEITERPPVWMMRQAGRILPQYNAIRRSLSGFKELVETPALAAEVTIQPVDELGVDAAIIFSDILVVPEAMGLTYEMVESRGPIFPNTIQSKKDIDQLLSGEVAAENLQYVYDAIQLTVKELNGRVPLIGFCGAPWTILAYMIEGSGSKTFSKAKKFLYEEPELAHLLLSKITETSIVYLKNQVKAGANLVQLFDSWAGVLSPDQYTLFSSKYIAQIVEAIKEVPITVFAKGAWFAWEDFASWNNCIVGLDWNFDPKKARNLLGEKTILQGNLDPCMLYSSEKTVEENTIKMLQSFGSHHIANLGHGVYPDTPLPQVKTFINTVKNYRYNSISI